MRSKNRRSGEWGVKRGGDTPLLPRPGRTIADGDSGLRRNDEKPRQISLISGGQFWPASVKCASNLGPGADRPLSRLQAVKVVEIGTGQSTDQAQTVSSGVSLQTSSRFLAA